MNILRIPMFVLAMAVSAHGFAATAQQEKMTACNAEATTKALKGDERKAFMSGCLKAGAPAGGKALSLIHISEPTRQAEISYAVFCLKKKKQKTDKRTKH